MYSHWDSRWRTTLLPQSFMLYCVEEQFYQSGYIEIETYSATEMLSNIVDTAHAQNP